MFNLFGQPLVSPQQTGKTSPGLFQFQQPQPHQQQHPVGLLGYAFPQQQPDQLLGAAQMPNTMPQQPQQGFGAPFGQRAHPTMGGGGGGSGGHGMDPEMMKMLMSFLGA